jgi:hypothetical protein
VEIRAGMGFKEGMVSSIDGKYDLLIKQKRNYPAEYDFAF